MPSKPANEATTDPEAAKPGDGSEVTTNSGDSKPPPNPTTSTSEPYRELIERALSLGRNAMSVWQELVDRHGFTGSYESVKRYARKLRGTQSPEACGIIETAPGEESQVDYGTGPMVRDAQTGKYRRTRLFVLTLGFSRKCVRLLRFHSSARIWAELHEEAFRRLGGTTRVMVPDNLKEGVLKPDSYDPALNPLYRDVLAHYGAVVMQCRVRHPDRKGKVESGVGHAQKTPLKGQRFESLEAAQLYLDRWEERWADTRIHGTTKRQVTPLFAEEQPSPSALARNDPGLLAKSDPPKLAQSGALAGATFGASRAIDLWYCWIQGTCTPSARMMSTPGIPCPQARPVLRVDYSIRAQVGHSS